MVLICGVAGDGPIELVADALEQMDTPFMILSPRRMEDLSFYYEIVNGYAEGEIACGGKSALLSEITGVYYRMVDFSVTPEYKHLPTNSMQYQQFRNNLEAVNHWINIADCKVLNQAEPMKSNSSKLYQMLLIKRTGLRIPDSFITNNTDSLQRHQSECGALIYKSCSGVRSIVSELKWDQSISLIENCPTLFQKKLEGTNYRVHVVGEKIFATKITSTAIDYRYAAKENKRTKLENVNLPLEIAQKCILLSKYLNLPLAGIDLMHTTNSDQWYCFEVNPSPGFSYYENYTGQPIADAIAEYLSTG